MENNNPPFKVGDEVVCVDVSTKLGNRIIPGNRVEDILAVGNHYKVTGVYKTCCNWVVTVGIRSWVMATVCSTCKKAYPTVGEWHFAAFRFKKIESNRYSNSVSKELAELALKERIETDVPEKVIPPSTVI